MDKPVDGFKMNEWTGVQEEVKQKYKATVRAAQKC